MVGGSELPPTICRILVGWLAFALGHVAALGHDAHGDADGPLVRTGRAVVLELTAEQAGEDGLALVEERHLAHRDVLLGAAELAQNAHADLRASELADGQADGALVRTGRAEALDLGAEGAADDDVVGVQERHLVDGDELEVAGGDFAGDALHGLGAGHVRILSSNCEAELQPASGLGAICARR